MTKEERPRLSPGTMFDHYIVEDFIGHGSFGDIYSVKEMDSRKKWALKLESTKITKPILTKEREFLEAIQKSEYFPRYKDYGEDDDYRWLVMELLGPSLIGLRRISPESSFTASTAIRLGIEMLKCIQEFHQYGFLHRDIKPGNFLLRPSRSHPLILIDYGLSRPYLDHNGDPIPPRDLPGFVGTVPYASMRAHRGEELGRCDDLFSWFAVLLKIHTGELPWPSVNDKAVVYAAKRDIDIAEFCVNLPHQYIEIYRYILTLERADEPDYDFIFRLLGCAMLDTRSSFADPFDWDSTPDIIVKTATTISLRRPMNENPIIPDAIPLEMAERLSIPFEPLPRKVSDTKKIETTEGGCCNIA